MSAWRYPRVLAHRGGGTLAPENTMAGLLEGMRRGYHAIEYDIMLARDGVPVVMHDPYLGRTVLGTGNVFDYDAQELAAMDAGSWFARASSGVRCL
jgi:glycerophosphoryl diester phosphodiesterase